MHHETATWQSPLLGHEMTLQVLGHAGARVLVFPTSMGTHSEWPDRRMHLVLQDQIDHGWIQLVCLDQPHHENWGNEAVSPGHRAWTHVQYYRHVQDEVLPYTAWKNPNPFVIATGASLGASHAVTFGLKYPEAVGRILGMSGLYDLKQMSGGYSDENVYAVNPMDFMRHEHAPRGVSRPSVAWTSSWRSAGAIRCTPTIASSRGFSGARASATRCGSGTARRTTGRTGSRWCGSIYGDTTENRSYQLSAIN